MHARVSSGRPERHIWMLSPWINRRTVLRVVGYMRRRMRGVRVAAAAFAVLLLLTPATAHIRMEVATEEDEMEHMGHAHHAGPLQDLVGVAARIHQHMLDR